MVPISTHHQLLGEKFADPEFRKSLEGALGDGVKRVSRLLSQMRFLAHEGHLGQESFPVEKMLLEAYQEAIRHQPTAGAQLKFDNTGAPFIITGDRAALKHAMSEIMINALQANLKKPQVDVRVDSTNSNAVTIEVQDTGAGFSIESAQKGTAPFYTTRNVGLGLGLAVSQKIIESHNGKLEIIPSPSGFVRVSLPMEVQTN